MSGQVARVGGPRNSYKILVRKLKGKDQSEYLGWNLEK